jgi:hypothetical protein
VETFRATSDTIACTLSQEELSDTTSAWRKLFRTALLERAEIPGGLRLVVNDASAEALQRLIEIERDCCRWITFELDGPEGVHDGRRGRQPRQYGQCGWSAPETLDVGPLPACRPGHPFGTALVYRLRPEAMETTAPQTQTRPPS